MISVQIRGLERITRVRQNFIFGLHRLPKLQIDYSDFTLLCIPQVTTLTGPEGRKNPKFTEKSPGPQLGRQNLYIHIDICLIFLFYSKTFIFNIHVHFQKTGQNAVNLFNIYDKTTELYHGRPYRVLKRFYKKNIWNFK